MPKRLNDQVNVKVAMAASAGVIGELVPTAVDTTGYGRARFIFNFGNGQGTTAALSTGAGVWKASTSGATYTLITGASMAAVTSGVISGGSITMVIDVPTDPSNVWLKVSGSLTSSGIPHNAVVELYDGINRPPTSSAQQIVVV